MLKKIIKILFLTISGLIALVIVLIFLAGDGYLNGFIAKEVTRQAGKSINGNLTIGSISGRLVSHFIIHDVRVIYDSDTMLTCRSIEIEYNPWQLLHKKLDIALLQIEDAAVRLRQDQDSSWNFTKIIKQSNEQNDTSKSASEWKISLNAFNLDNFSAGIDAIDTVRIPSSVNCDISLKGSFSVDTIRADIESMTLSTKKPDFEIVSFKGGINKEENEIEWRNIRIELRNTIAKSEGYYNTRNESADAKLEFSPLALEDFDSFLKGMKIFGQPHLSAKVSGNPAEYSFSLNIEEKSQKIDLSGKINNIRNDPSYSTLLDVSGLDGSSWTHDKDLKSDISGKVEVSGKGFRPEENEINLKGSFREMKYGGYSLQGLTIDAKKQKDVVSGKIGALALAGHADIRFDLSDVFGDPAYDLNAVFRNINAGRLPGLDSISSALNGTVNVKGKGISPGKLKAAIGVKIFDSEINDQEINDIQIIADYNKGLYNFTIPGFETPFFRLEAKGQGNVKGDNDIDFHIEPLNLYSLLKYFSLPEASATGSITGNISGKTDSLRAKLNIDLDNLSYDTIRAGSLKADIDALISGKSYSGTVQLASGDIHYGSFKVKDASLKAELSGNDVRADLKLNVNDSLNAAFRGTIRGFDNPLIFINNLAVQYMGSAWESSTDSASVKLDKDAFYINSFGMSSGDQQMNVNGKLAFHGNEDLSLAINRLHLESLPLNNLLPYDVTGTISARMSLKGTSSDPFVDAVLSADSVSLNKYRIDSVRVLMNYKKEMLSAEGLAGFGQKEPVKISAGVPFRLSLSDSTTMLKDKPGLFASVSLDSLDLGEISSMIPIEGVSFSGSANAGAEVSNTINDPVIKGSLDISNGSFKNREFGIDYRNIGVSAKVDSGMLSINKFIVKGGKGSLDLKGSINLNTADSLNTKDLAMKMNARDFEAMKSGTAELNFNSDIGITGSFAQPVMKGSLRINNSKLNVDYFTSKMSRIKDESDLPLLEQALSDTVQIDIPADTVSSGISGTSLFRDLKGELMVDIPGNTWVTGKDMNFELNGTLRVVKSSPEVSLFGDLNVQRGYYKIYGRRFEFNKGTITFTGSTEFNPELSVEIVYRFRDIEKNMRDLKLDISGKLMQPQYSFMLDNEALEEKDAISYIAFGKSINQLGEGEKEKMSGQDIAMGAAVTQLSSVLKGVLQQEAGIDVFEFTGGEDWKSGSVTIGKYITNKLYLSYDRNFDFDKTRKTSVSEKIMLEYQVLRNLLLKITNQDVNSGFDLIWKKNWE